MHINITTTDMNPENIVRLRRKQTKSRKTMRSVFGSMLFLAGIVLGLADFGYAREASAMLVRPEFGTAALINVEENDVTITSDGAAAHNTHLTDCGTPPDPDIRELVADWNAMKPTGTIAIWDEARTGQVLAQRTFNYTIDAPGENGQCTGGDGFPAHFVSTDHIDVSALTTNGKYWVDVTLCHINGTSCATSTGWFLISKRPPTCTVAPDTIAWGPGNLSVTLSGTASGRNMARFEYCWTHGVDCDPQTDSLKGSVSCSSGASCTKTITQASDGQYNVCAESVDAKNVRSARACDGLYQKDSSAPLLDSLSPPSPSWITSGNMSALAMYTDQNPLGRGYSGMSTLYACFNTSACDPVTGPGAKPSFTCARGTQSCSTTFTESADGIYYLCVKAKDTAGNMSSTTCNSPYKKDTRVPDFVSISPTSRDWNPSSVSVTLTYSDTNPNGNGASNMSKLWGCWTTGASCDPLTGTSISCDSGGVYPVTCSKAFSQSLQGNWSFCSLGEDAAGNRSARRCQVNSYKIDNTPPSCTPDPEPTVGTSNNTPLLVDIDCSDSGGSLLESAKYRINATASAANGTSFGPSSGTAPITRGAIDDNYLTYWVKDNAGNTASGMWFTYYTCGANSEYNAGSQSCICSANYHLSGGVCVLNTCSPTNAPANSTACNTNAPATDLTPWTNTCSGSTACRFTCNANYHAVGNTCVANVCATPAPANGTICAGDNSSVPADNMPFTVVASCTATKCEYTCDAGYHKVGNACVLNTCDPASAPTNSTACNANAPATDLTTWTSTCSGSTACRFTCNANYHAVGNTCVANVCATPAPANGTICAGDNSSVPADNMPFTVVASCTATKCEYTCDAGFHAVGNSCVANTCDPASAPTNSTACNLNTPAVHLTTWASTCSGSTACRFTCNAGYHAVGNSCVQNACDPLTPPGGGVACNSNIPAADGSAWSLVPQASCGATACTYYTPTYTCGSPPPAPDGIASVNCENKPATGAGQFYNHDESCVGPCSYKCNTNYHWSGVACVANTCAAPTFSNAAICAGDNVSVPTDNMGSTVVASCTATKCEYTCDAGYHAVGNTCVANTCDPASAPTNSTACNANAPAVHLTTWTNTCSGILGCRFTCNATYAWNGSACIISASCGNGTTDAGEQCDDSNINNNDGCSSSCQWETKTNTCAGKPGAATTIYNTVPSYLQTCTASNGTTCTAWNYPDDATTQYDNAPADPTTTCQYTCAVGYTWDGSACAAAAGLETPWIQYGPDEEWDVEIAAVASDVITRAEAAQIIADRFNLPELDCRTFDDVPTTHKNYAAIMALSDNGITAGCTADNFCPDLLLDRIEMAVFLTRLSNFAPDLPNATGPNDYIDVVFPEDLTPDGNLFYYGNIFFKRNTAAPCDKNKFCPGDDVLRTDFEDTSKVVSNNNEEGKNNVLELIAPLPGTMVNDPAYKAILTPHIMKFSGADVKLGCGAWEPMKKNDATGDYEANLTLGEGKNTLFFRVYGAKNDAYLLPEPTVTYIHSDVTYLAPAVPECGTADGYTYPLDATEWAPYTQCESGNPTDTFFPDPGMVVTWYCEDGALSSDVCTARRNTATNQPPVLNAVFDPVSGPSTLDVTVNVTASDPDDDALYYTYYYDYNANPDLIKIFADPSIPVGGDGNRLDYNSDMVLDGTDYDMLRDTINSGDVCPEKKFCDIDGTEDLDATDLVAYGGFLHREGVDYPLTALYSYGENGFYEARVQVTDMVNPPVWKGHLIVVGDGSCMFEVNPAADKYTGYIGESFQFSANPELAGCFIGTDPEWTRLDSFESFSFTEPYEAKAPSFAEYNGELFTAWYSSSDNQLHVKKYSPDTKTWSDAGLIIDGFSDFEFSDADRNTPTLVTYNGSLFMIFPYPNANGYDRLRILQYEQGMVWAFVSPNPLVIPGHETGDWRVNHSDAIEYNGELYVVWEECLRTNPDRDYCDIAAAKWNESGGWTVLSDRLDARSDRDSDARYPNAEIYNGELFVSWSELPAGWAFDEDTEFPQDFKAGLPYQIKMKKYDGSSWVDLLERTNWNYDNTPDDGTKTSGRYPNMEVYNGKLYLMWTEGEDFNTAGDIRYRVFDGTTWSNDGGPLLCSGNPSHSAKRAYLENYNGDLYVVRACGTAGEYPLGASHYLPTSHEDFLDFRLEVSKFNDSAWSTVPDIATSGLHDTMPALYASGDKLFLGFAETTDKNKNPLARQMSVYELSIPEDSVDTYSWDFADGQSSEEPDPSHVYMASQDPYTVMLTAETKGGLSASGTLDISVLASGTLFTTVVGTNLADTTPDYPIPLTVWYSTPLRAWPICTSPGSPCDPGSYRIELFDSNPEDCSCANEKIKDLWGPGYCK